ncbi:unnamed protein product [Dimorphilus gyrociliatus]|uniref:Exoribonuclease phosphorolytic domain-containing protein n=1 Tax=Dimorphilus gyrociliatus TaxID=2664684 RepID=A0A7I8VQE4_9ANNE|nr:unnamed protein product [Dimorphilus gyrociliatus]
MGICEFGVITKADGSARYITDKSDAICAVYGPIEVKLSKELIDRSSIEVQVYPKSGNTGPPERLVETIIRTTLDSVVLTKYYPRSAISVIVQLKHDFDLSCVLNSVCLALLDAAIPMKTMFSAISVSKSDLDNSCLNDSTMNFVLDRNYKVLTSYSNGIWKEDELKLALTFATKKAESIFEFYKSSIERKLLKEERS